MLKFNLMDFIHVVSYENELLSMGGTAVLMCVRVCVSVSGNEQSADLVGEP